jgi:hypothetical protein
MVAKPGPTLGQRIHRQLLKVFGPAQLSPVNSRKPLDEAATQRAATALQGWKVATDSTGRSYLVREEPPKG